MRRTAMDRAPTERKELNSHATRPDGCGHDAGIGVGCSGLVALRDDLSRQHRAERATAQPGRRARRVPVQTGLSRAAADTGAFKACMGPHGYRWLSTKLVRDPSGPPRDSSFIDPDTGLSCRNTGIASICVPPRGTERYNNEEGLNGTRAGLAESARTSSAATSTGGSAKTSSPRDAAAPSGACRGLRGPCARPGARQVLPRGYWLCGRRGLRRCA